MWIISLNATPPILVADDANNGVHSPDGRRIAYTTTAGTKILTASSSGGGATRILTAAGYDTFPFLLCPPKGTFSLSGAIFR